MYLDPEIVLLKGVKLPPECSSVQRKVSISFSKQFNSIVSIFQYSLKIFLKKSFDTLLLSVPVAGITYELQGTHLTIEIFW